MSRVTIQVLAALALAGCGKAEETEACYALSDTAGDATCEPADDVDPDALSHEGWCGTRVVSVDGEGERRQAFQVGVPACCYPVKARNTEPNCVVGRPYIEAAGQATAPFPASGSPGARAWVAAARAEHASIAAFARLTLDLMALGAPTELLAAVQQAGADEADHTARCLAVARHLGASPSLAPFPFTDPVVPRSDPVAVAVAAAREGCLGETVGAFLAEHAADRAEARGADPLIAETLRVIADDEARHAALSWRIVAWLVRTGGAPVRHAVAEALAVPLDVSRAPHLWDGEDDRRVPDLLAAAHAQVLEPAAALLLQA